jgi:hypothetical protein
MDTLPESPSVSSGALVPDVSLTSSDVRSDVTTKDTDTDEVKRREVSDGVRGECVTLSWKP